MTTIEERALALLNAQRVCLRPLTMAEALHIHGWVLKALCEPLKELDAERADHADFRQEVSDAVSGCVLGGQAEDRLSRFILPKPKPDPLVEALESALWDVSSIKLTAEELTTISGAVRKLVEVGDA